VRFAALKKYYENDHFVLCYNVSSVPLEAFPLESEVVSFYQTVHTNLNNTPIEEMLRWLRQDIDYIKSHQILQNGIEWIKKSNGIDHFDIVLIDGSEFTGKAELDLVYGAKFILLDDTNAFKNYNNYKKLLQDPSYELLEEDQKVRNGYAIFKLKR
jgi:hypothetical protein